MQKTPNFIEFTAEERDRFCRKVAIRDTGCWEWAGTMGNTYGAFWITRARRISFLAHRASYIMHKGEIPEGAVICHQCDNRKCVNPAHLLPGTQSENMKEMYSRGRYPRRRTHAELSEAAKRRAGPA